MSARPDDATRVEIGDGNTIREYVTIQRGTLKEAAALTRVGDHNWIMNAVHIGHDSIIGNHNILANNTGLAALMVPFATMLSAQDMTEVGVYYATQEEGAGIADDTIIAAGPNEGMESHQENGRESGRGRGRQYEYD